VRVLSEGRERPGIWQEWQDAALILGVVIAMNAAVWIATFLLFEWLA
jgi:hypothetical protein